MNLFHVLKGNWSEKCASSPYFLRFYTVASTVLYNVYGEPLHLIRVPIQVFEPKTTHVSACYTYSRVQWFSTFFRFYHMAAFHEWDLLVLRPSLRGRAAKFSFSKNHRDLKNEYFFLKICRILPNTSKNNCQK